MTREAGEHYQPNAQLCDCSRGPLPFSWACACLHGLVTLKAPSQQRATCSVMFDRHAAQPNNGVCQDESHCRSILKCPPRTTRNVCYNDASQTQRKPALKGLPVKDCQYRTRTIRMPFLSGTTGLDGQSTSCAKHMLVLTGQWCGLRATGRYPERMTNLPKCADSQTSLHIWSAQ